MRFSLLLPANFLAFLESANQKCNAQRRERVWKANSKLKIDRQQHTEKWKSANGNWQPATGNTGNLQHSACHCHCYREMRRAQQLLCSSKNPLEALPAAKSLPSDSNDASNDIVKSEAQLPAVAGCRLLAGWLPACCWFQLPSCRMWPASDFLAWRFHRRGEGHRVAAAIAFG